MPTVEDGASLCLAVHPTSDGNQLAPLRCIRTHAAPVWAAGRPNLGQAGKMTRVRQAEKGRLSAPSIRPLRQLRRSLTWYEAQSSASQHGIASTDARSGGIMYIPTRIATMKARQR